MPGTIRVMLGLLIAFAAVGGMDNSTDAQLAVLTVLALMGVAVMYSGVRAMRRA